MHKNWFQPKSVFNDDFAEANYNRLVRLGYSDEDIYDMSSEEINAYLLLSSDFEIKTFNEAKAAFDKGDAPNILIIQALAFHLLDSDSGKPTFNLNDIKKLASDLEPIFDKWVW